MNDLVKNTIISIKKHPKCDYLFYKQDGTRLRRFEKSFFTALEKSGIKNFRFHDTRHCFCSNLMMSGADLNTVRELAGHKSMKMTLRYSHLSRDYKKRAVDFLSESMHNVFGDLGTNKAPAGFESSHIEPCEEASI